LKRTFFLTLFFFFSLTLIFSYGTAAQFSSQTTMLIDQKGFVEQTKSGIFLVAGDEFAIFNNDKIVTVNYTHGNITIFNEKTIKQIIILPVYDNSYITVTNYTGAVVLEGRIYESSFWNIMSFVLGDKMSETFIMMPFGTAFGLLFTVSFLQLCKRRKI